MSATRLHVTLGDIKGGDSGVGGTASQNTTEQALAVVRGVMGHWAEIPFQNAETRSISTRRDRAGERGYRPCIPFFCWSQVCHCVSRLGRGRSGGGGGEGDDGCGFAVSRKKMAYNGNGSRVPVHADRADLLVTPLTHNHD